MTFFAHFNSAQVWMVLVQEDNNSYHLETWLAPEGRDGVRRIFRQTRASIRPLAAVALPKLGLLGRPRGGLSGSLKDKVKGEEQAVFIMDNDEGTCRIEVVRGRTPADAVRKSGYESEAVGGFHMDLVRSHVWAMRRVLDQQNPRTADMNLLHGDGLPQGLDEEEKMFAKRPHLWTKQARDESDQDNSEA